ncbi:MAG TPA: hypothetical protein VJ783_06640 [Pirellulales bacterium]|nr:hypothetical protein [Pirellulales bacterium]
MIGRLIGGVAALIAVLCVATVAAETLLLGYLYSRGKLDEPTVLRVVAAANGIEISPPTPTKVEDPNGGEEVSLEALARARALKSRDIELREQSLGENMAVVKVEYNKLIEEKDRYERIKTAFRAQLDELREGVLANNRETARLILESMKSKQAKDQILRMFKEGEANDVVKLLSLMPTAKRKKILDEFKTDEEAQTLAEILKLIREGVPETKLIDETEKAIDLPDEAAKPSAGPR